MHLLQTVLDASNRQKQCKNTIYLTICNTSDGEAKHGNVLVILTMGSQLAMAFLIYKQLTLLQLINLLVGLENITTNKDLKHIIKHQRNVLMCNKGIEIQGFSITPAILQLHLESNGVFSHYIRSLLNPNDKQDVILAYLLLKEIWFLPPPLAGSSLGFAQAQEALNLYGQFACHLMMPYICVDIDLDEQLIHLSMAIHIVKT